MPLCVAQLQLEFSSGLAPYARNATALHRQCVAEDRAFAGTAANAVKVEPEPKDESLNILSSRELERMDCVTKGKPNQEIGLILEISTFTVKNNLQRIFKKLKVLNRAQAVAKFRK